MCCFAAPAATAVVTTVMKKKIPKEYEIGKLNTMLWGGVAMLVVDHIVSGELVPYFPFVTKSWAEIWPEILQVGVPMTLLIVAIWGGMLVGKNLAKQRSFREVRI